MSSVKRTPGEGQKDLNKMIAGLDKKHVGKAGWFEGMKYVDGQSVALVAQQNEFGNPAKNIPPRPFMRPTLTEKEALLRKIADSEIRKMAKGKSTWDESVFIISAKFVGEVKKKITEIMSPPLKASTIAARLRKRKDKVTVGKLDKPLVDTGIMLNSMTNKVENE